MNAAPQNITRVRRNYNKWVANQTLEDYALRFTAKRARKWSAFVVVNAALGAISFLALEAIGGAITLAYGFHNSVAAILVVSAIIFATGLPIAYYAARYGIDIDLLTRGAGFGYIGSTITSLIYASFTFIYFAIEAAIMSLALELCFNVPLPIGYLISAVAVIPLVTYGFTFISRLQLWSQPLWLLLHMLPFFAIAMNAQGSVEAWISFEGTAATGPAGFDILMFGAASIVVFSLVAQIGEQVDFLRFLPRREKGDIKWLAALVAAGPGWIIPGALKLIAGSFLAVLSLQHLVPMEKASEPTQMYLTAFRYVFSSPEVALAFTGAFVILSQLKINVTNAYAGSIAWSNFFSRLTRSHPGRVVWLVFNVAIALVLMQLGIFKALEHILGLYSILAIAWVGALVADLVINKPLGLSPKGIEFKRANLFDINPVGVGSMAIACLAGLCCFAGFFGAMAQALASFFTLFTAFVAAPLIAIMTSGRYYLARHVADNDIATAEARCCICEHVFEAEDMAHCPAYDGPICSLCCLLDSRCHDRCKTSPRVTSRAAMAILDRVPASLKLWIQSEVAQYAGVFSLFLLVLGAIILLVYQQQIPPDLAADTHLRTVLWSIFSILALIGGVAAWLFVLTQDSRRVAEEETARQTELLFREIEAHKRTDAMLQKAKETAEAASQAKSRYVTGLSHELRTPLNAILGYAQLLERDSSIPPRRAASIKTIRRSAEHLSGLIDGLLDVSRIEAGRVRLARDEVRLHDFLAQITDMFRLQATSKGLEFRYEETSGLPDLVYADESRLRQVLINLLSNAMKFTDTGFVALRISYRNQIATFEIEDSGPGIKPEDLSRIFEPFVRAQINGAAATKGIGLGLTITRSLVAMMGGEVDLSSKPGQGSVFRVRLLLSAVLTPRPATAINRQIIGYEGRRRTVLVADDDAIHRAIIHEILAPLGFGILDAIDGPGCLEAVAQSEPDIILLDVLMPNLSGWEVAEMIRKRGFVSCRIVMLSANLGEAHRTLSPDRAHDDYLLKPIDVSQFLQKLQKQLTLDWVHAPDARPVANPVAADIALPDDAHIAELLHFGQIGYVRGIHAKLDEIEKIDARFIPFARELRRFANAFDLDGFLTTLSGGRRQ